MQKPLPRRIGTPLPVPETSNYSGPRNHEVIPLDLNAFKHKCVYYKQILTRQSVLNILTFLPTKTPATALGRERLRYALMLEHRFQLAEDLQFSNYRM
jgi:hypothetical protein